MFKEQFSNQSGQVAVIVAILIVVLVGMAAYVIDVGSLYETRRSLQTAADAAALAGAQELPDTSAASDAAIECGSKNNESVGVIDINTEMISIMALRHNLAMNFAQVLWRSSADVRAYAKAKIGSPSEIGSLSEMGYSSDYANYVVPWGLLEGVSYDFLDDEILDSGLPGFFQPLEIGPGLYQDSIKSGVISPVWIGREYNSVIGASGTTVGAVEDRINQKLNYQLDDYAYLTNNDELAKLDSQFVICPVISDVLPGTFKIEDFLPFIITGIDGNKVMIELLDKALIMNNSEMEGPSLTNGIRIIRLTE